jgi:hypothetical protein
MTRLAEVLLKLFGVYLMIGALSAFGSAIASYLQFKGAASTATSDFLLGLGVTALGLAIFQVLPGALLIRWSDSIARRLFPADVDPSPSSIGLRGGYVLGCTLIGLLFLITGASTLAGGLVQLTALPFSEELDSAYIRISLLEPFASGAVELGLGYLLYRHAEHESQALRRTPPDSQPG